jgi:hypothetical protein
MSTPPRYVPARPLPAYAYVPGRSPAPPPVTDPGALPEMPRSADDAPGDWRGHPLFLWGLDLYNHGFPWEAHEAWESLWLAAPRGSVVRDMLQGLIQCAAAVVHARAGRAVGVARMIERALGRLAEVRARGGSSCLGVEIGALADAMRAYGQQHDAEAWPRIVLAATASLPGAGGASGVSG